MLSPSLIAPTTPISEPPASADPPLRLVHAMASAATGSDVEVEYDRCASLFHRFFAVRLGNDPHTADDLMQQLWLAANRNGRHVPAAECEFWLRGVARNLLATHWRRHARPVVAPVADPALAAELADSLDAAPLPSALVEKREIRDQLLLALTELSAAEHELIVAHYWGNVGFAEIGRRLGLSVRAVEGRMYRARTALRERLRALEG